MTNENLPSPDWRGEGLRTVTFYNRTRLMPILCRGSSRMTARQLYYLRRREMRLLRRTSPNHLDVLWYNDSLSLTPVDSGVTKRHFAYNGLFLCCIGITGPVGKLP